MRQFIAKIPKVELDRDVEDIAGGELSLRPAGGERGFAARSGA